MVASRERNPVRSNLLVPSSGSPPPGSLLGVNVVRHDSLPLSADFKWIVDLCGQIVQGGVYLLGGPPGGNKSTLSRQLALDLASRGHRALFILTEEPPSRLKASLLRMMAGWPQEKVQRALGNLSVEGSVQDLELLPTYFARNVLAPGAPFRGTKLVVLDSIQGNGVSHTALEKFRALHEFGDLCRASAVTAVWITHLNKRGEYAGLRATEHAIDAALMLRKAGSTRHIGVPKNRFGAESHRLFPLEIDSDTVTLRPSPRAAMTAAVSRSFLAGIGSVELQGAVTLPKFGSPPRVMAPGLPRREIELLVACLAQVPGTELDDLATTISCRIPGDGRYCSLLGLPLCLSLVASLQQRPLPPNQLAVGEVDLTRSVRALPELLLHELADAVGGPSLPLPLRLLVPPSSVSFLPRVKGLQVVPCATLDDAIQQAWAPEGGMR